MKNEANKLSYIVCDVYRYVVYTRITTATTFLNRSLVFVGYVC